MPGSLIAGAQRVVITPPVGVDLCGFGGRKGPSAGVHDDLRACALYLSGGELEILIITADLIGLHHEEVAEVRAGIRERTGIDPAGVMVSCSHTHSGPATHCLRCLGKQDEEYLAELKLKLVGLAQFAKSSAQPAQAGAARQPVSVGINRREARGSEIVLGVNEGGLTAPYVDALYVDDVEGNPIARLFCHAAHAVTLGGDNLLISGDWPGYAQRELERCCGGDCVALFMQGCCGNINSHPRGTFDIAQSQGRTVASAVLQADSRAPRDKAPALGAVSEVMGLPLMDPPPLEEAERIHSDALAQAQAAQGSGNPRTEMMYEGLVQWAAGVLALAKAGPAKRELPYEIQALRVGDLGILGLPGEVFVEYALNIDKASPLPLTAVAAYTNGNIGYVPTAAAYAEGGYEVESAICYYGTTMQTPESEELILRQAERLAQQQA